MGILIKEANLSEDRDLMIKLLRDNRPRLSADYPFEKRYKWLYEDNPHGKAKAWLAIDDGSSDVVGFTIALPRKMNVLGQQIFCWNCADFSIAKKYRTLGVAIKLRKAARNCVHNGEIPFLYAHPNERMLVVHQRAGHKVIGKMIRYTKLLKSEQKMEDILKSSILSKSVAKIANIALNTSIVKELQYRSKSRFSIEKVDKFSEEFDSLFEKVRDRYTVCGVRDSEYLNWRYCENPIYKTETLALYEDNNLAGYIIYLIKDESISIKDIFCLDNKIAKYLLANLIQESRKRKFQSVSATLLHLNPFIEALEFFGFRLRPDSISSMIAYASPDSEFAETILDGQNWFITVGDRDE